MAVVDVSFNVVGDVIPADHGYALLSAVSEIVPEVHGDNAVGIHPIPGTLTGNRTLALTDRSRLVIRIPSERLPQILPLAGKRLRIGEHGLGIGVPTTHALKPKARLYSRLVVIKGFLEPEPFLQAAGRQLEDLGIKGGAHLVAQPQVVQANKGKSTGSRSPFLRRTVRIRDKEVVGFALNVEGLTAEESILLQERGLGGRRRFGCGVFVGARGE